MSNNITIEELRISRGYGLDELGLKYKTDKASSTHGYLEIYQKYLRKRRKDALNLLEIGVGAGGSLRMWQEYMPNATIYGMDINPDVASNGVYIGDATSEPFLINFISNVGGLDIIIDDGSHVGKDMMTTFKTLFTLGLKSDGLYFLEDTHTLYSEHYSGAFQENGRSEAYNFFTDLPYHIDVAGRAMTGNQQYAIDWPIQEPPVPKYSRILKAAHFYPSLWIYERT